LRQWASASTDGDGEPNILRQARHGSGYGDAAWQVAVVDKVMLGEPHEVCSKSIQSTDLVQNLRMERAVIESAISQPQRHSGPVCS
jgi:alkyl sulfatase BDS1-like metallo-beta-lactamase superfamily hydrolase